MKMVKKSLLTGIIIFLLCMGTLLQGCSAPQEKEKEVIYEFYYSTDYWDLMPLEKSYFSTQDSMEQTIQEYIVEIEDLLGIHGWWKEAAPNAQTIGFNIQISTSGASWAYKLAKADGKHTEATLILNMSSWDGAAAHELTHIMISDDFSFSRSLEEGLCNYVQSQVGAYIDMEKNGWDIEEYLKSEITTMESYYGISKEESAEITDSIGIALNGYSYGTGTPNCLIWYAYSQAFVTYLIRTYGMEAVVELIRNGTDESSYNQYLGKTFEKVKEEWLIHYNELDASITLKEVQQVILEMREQQRMSSEKSQ